MNPHKYHERGNRLVQINRLGVWHGYIGGMLQYSFGSESEALKWLNQ